jgi:hypothetical protein
MKKSTLIARFLVNLRSGIDLEHAEHIVAVTFLEQHPKVNFHSWNIELNDRWCEDLVRANPSPSYVNVENFIKDLWDIH